MATKPKAASTAVVAKKSTAVVDIKALLKQQAAAVSDKTEPASGISIRVTQDKQFLLPDGRKSSGPIDVVIVEFNSQNRFYETDFDAKNVVPPSCFSIGQNPKTLVPSNNSPVKQADACSSCPMNEFGSKKDGKACQNSRVMAVLPPDADENTPIWLLRTSPTACKGFDAYVGSVVGSFAVPPIGVVTEIGFDSSVTYSKLTFGNPRPNENVESMIGRQEEARRLLDQEPDVSSYKAPQAKKAAVAGGRRR